MRVSLSKDLHDGAWTLHQRASLLDAAALVEWREQLLIATEPLEQRIDLLVDLSGLTLHPSIAELYELALRDELAARARHLLHYGASPGTAAALRVAYVHAPLYPDRATALAILEDIRRERVLLRRSGAVLSPTAEDCEFEVRIREKRR